MTFNDYQLLTAKTAHIYKQAINDLCQLHGCDKSPIEDMLRLSYIGLGLGEAGEIQGKIKKIIRDSKGVITVEVKKAIKKELGDLLWYVAETCTALEITMDDCAEGNISKLADRKERGVLGGDGDDR